MRRARDVSGPRALRSLLVLAVPLSLYSLPVHFEPNRGQAPAGVLYLARSVGRIAQFTSAGPVFSGIRMSLEGAHRLAAEPVSPLPGRSHYFMGRDPARWRTGVPNFAGLRYRAVYPGVDLLFHGASGGLEYDFTLAPGADPRATVFRAAWFRSIWALTTTRARW
jgi:hypothetical protein